MSQSDPIADFITVIRNGVRSRKGNVEAPYSRMKEDICRILADEGFIDGFEQFDVTNHKGNKLPRLRITLRYADDLRTVSPITQLERISSPGRRVYVTRRDLPRVRGGLGVSILSTSAGVVSDKIARQKNVGGELLVKVW
ncbi:MAG: 30S ribosomal protein S8 [bacterium]|nr:30S ribosomal protein S8 [bacterium]